MSKPSQDIIYVSTQQVFDQLCAHWITLPMLALDTEFMRTNTYFPRPALIQVNDGKTNYLIDPLTLSDFSGFSRLLSCPQVTKVLHACSEDLEVFHRLFGVLPNALFDTQVAAAFVGLGFSLGYGGLVEAQLNIQLPKGETRSDWLQRPLTEAQKHYAAMDVEYLYVIAQRLMAQLSQLQRKEWVEDECQNLVRSYVESQSLDSAIMRFRGAWRLNERQLALLIQLSQWRDQTAQQRDVPRSYVVKDKSLYQIAEIMPSHVAQLRKIEELSDKSIKRYGDELIAMVEATSALNEAQLPQRLPKSPSSRQQNTIKILREKFAEVAQELNLAPEYLARKKDYEFIVRAAEQGATGNGLLPESFLGWREKYVKPVVMKYL